MINIVCSKIEYSTKHLLCGVLLFVLLIEIIPQIQGAECPYYCDCKWKNGKETIICMNINITKIPYRLDTGTQVLDLSKTNVTVLEQDEFAKRGLVNLQKLYITSSKLKWIHKYTFRKLVNLVDLDLSNNLLETIPTHAFGEIVELRELKLKGNLIKRIINHAFVNVPSLVRLDLSDCRINVIEPRAFFNLESTLEWLRIDGNQLQDVRNLAIVQLESLHGLELARNPWNCSCNLRSLLDWIYKYNIPFGDPPNCNEPPRLKGRSWNNLDIEEFGCVPNITAYQKVIRSTEGQNVTLTCIVKGIPTPIVRWTFRNNVTERKITPSTRIRNLDVKGQLSNLTIHKLDAYDAGTYTCIAENNAGIVEAKIQLIVAKIYYTGSVKTITLICVIVLALILVCATWLMAIYLLMSKDKKLLPLWKMKRAKHVLYHKIEIDKRNNGMNGGGGGGDSMAATAIDHGLTTDEDKYDAYYVKHLRRRTASDTDTGFNEGYELSTKLINTNQRKPFTCDTDVKNARKENVFAFRSPKKYRTLRTKEDPPDIFKEQNASLLNLRSYDSDYENIPLRACAPRKIIHTNTSSPSSSSTNAKNVYHRGENIEQQYYDDFYNQNQYYRVTSIADIHAKQRPKTDTTSNYSLASIFNPDHRESTLSCLNNNASNESTFSNHSANLPTIASSPNNYRVNQYENNNSSKGPNIASITPSALLNYPTPLQTLYAQKFNNNKYFNSNQNR